MHEKQQFNFEGIDDYLKFSDLKSIYHNGELGKYIEDLGTQNKSTKDVDIKPKRNIAMSDIVQLMKDSRMSNPEDGESLDEMCKRLILEHLENNG